MSSIHPTEGLTYGNGDYLPDASVLEGFDFRGNVLDGTFMVAALPDYPDCVVRAEDVYKPNAVDYYDVAEQGIAHFQQMEQAGVHVPAQRFVVAASVFRPHGSMLYAITDRITGRKLTNEPVDSHLSAPVIDGMASYFSWVLNEPDETQFLWDKIWSWQFTVTGEEAAEAKPVPQVVLHDIGLDFIEAKQGSKPSRNLYQSSVGLEAWARDADIAPPENVQKLIRQVESLPKRLIRRIINM